MKERVLTALSDIETRVIQDIDFVRALVEFYLRILSQSNAIPMRKVIGRAVECATVPVFIRAQYKHPVCPCLHDTGRKFEADRDIGTGQKFGRFGGTTSTTSE